VCCSVLQRVAACCSVLQFELEDRKEHMGDLLLYIFVMHCVLQCVFFAVLVACAGV